MYDLHRAVAVVAEVLERRRGITIVRLEMSGGYKKGVNYPRLTGEVNPGDRVLVNTTAVDLGLGSGGFHPVLANISLTGSSAGVEQETGIRWAGKLGIKPGQGREEREQNTYVFADSDRGSFPGHIMKLRYTPLQVRTLSVEEKKSPYREQIEKFSDLNEIPVVVLPLHSLLAPLAAVFRVFNPGGRLIYIMTGGGSMSLEFSRTVASLCERGLLSGTVTCGQTFGGDLEAVNIFTALAAADTVLAADMIAVGMGPGIAGTATALGFSGTENVFNCYAVRVLGGRPVLVPRVSLADKRERHFIVSHHTETILARLVDFELEAVFPDHYLIRQYIEKNEWQEQLELYFSAYGMVDKILRNSELEFRSMGRKYRDDPLYFITGGLPVSVLGGKCGKRSDYNGAKRKTT